MAENTLEWLERALRLFERLEWSELTNYPDPIDGISAIRMCPACKGVKKTQTSIEHIYIGAGHRQGCELAWVLENKPEGGEGQ